MQEMKVQDMILFIPSGELSDKIIIGDRVCKTKVIFDQIEQYTGIKILAKRDKIIRAVKNYQNVSIKLPEVEFKGF